MKLWYLPDRVQNSGGRGAGAGRHKGKSADVCNDGKAMLRHTYLQGKRASIRGEVLYAGPLLAGADRGGKYRHAVKVKSQAKFCLASNPGIWTLLLPSEIRDSFTFIYFSRRNCRIKYCK